MGLQRKGTSNSADMTQIHPAASPCMDLRRHSWDLGGYFYFHFAVGAKKPLYFEKLQTLIGYG